MRDWYEKLEPRERVIVIAGAVVSALLFYFLVIWEPASARSERLRSDTQDIRELAEFLERAAVEAGQYGNVGQTAGGQRNRSLLAVVDGSAKQQGLNEWIKRIQPEGQTEVRLWIEGAPFEQLAMWLHQLDTRESIRVEDGSLDRDRKAGTVKARLTLKRSAP